MKKSEKNHWQNLIHYLIKIKLVVALLFISELLSFIFHSNWSIDCHKVFHLMNLFDAEEKVLVSLFLIFKKLIIWHLLFLNVILTINKMRLCWSSWIVGAAWIEIWIVNFILGRSAFLLPCCFLLMILFLAIIEVI